VQNLQTETRLNHVEAEVNRKLGIATSTCTSTSLGQRTSPNKKQNDELLFIQLLSCG